MPRFSNPTDLNKHLEDKSYVDGYTPSQADVEALSSFSSVDEKLVHAARWHRHISSFSNSDRTSWRAAAAAPVAETAAPSKAASNDDDFDLFGDETEEETAARQARDEEIEARAKEAMEKSKNKGVVMKSAIVIDVKPWDDTTDMKVVEAKVREIEMEGLEWKAAKLTPIGYGIKKLQISCHVVDDVVSVDDICEKIQELEDLVQSTDISTFTKL